MTTTGKIRRQYPKGYTSVTTVIGGNLGWGKAGLMHWAWQKGIDGEDYRRARDSAASAGTLAHDAIEHALAGEPYAFPDGADESEVDRARIAYAAFLAWRQGSPLEIVASELVLLADVEASDGTMVQVSGTADAFFRCGDENIAGDFKTGKVHDEAVIQIAAYDEMRRLSGAPRCDRGVILHFPVSGEPPREVPVTREMMDDGLRAFRALLTLHTTAKKIKLPTTKGTP